MKKHNPYPSLTSKNNLSDYLEAAYSSLEGIPAWGFTRPSKIDLKASDFESRAKYLSSHYVDLWPSTVGLRQAVWLYSHGSLSALCNEEQAFFLGLAFTTLRRPNASWPLTGWNSSFKLVKANLNQEPLPAPYSAGGYYVSSVYRAAKDLHPMNPHISLHNGWLWKVDRNELDELSKSGLLKDYLACDDNQDIIDFLTSKGAKPCPWQAIALLGFTTGVPFSRLVKGTWLTNQSIRNLYEWLVRVFPEGGHDIDQLRKIVDFGTTVVDHAIAQRPIKVAKCDWTGSKFNKPVKTKTSKRLNALEEVSLEDLFGHSCAGIDLSEFAAKDPDLSLLEPNNVALGVVDDTPSGLKLHSAVGVEKLSIFDLLSSQDEEDED